VIITKKVGKQHSERNVNAAIFAATRRQSGPLRGYPHLWAIPNREPATRGIFFALSNRELSIACNASIPGKITPQNSKNSVNIYKWSTESEVSYRKHSPEKFLTGAGTRFRMTAIPPLLHPKEDECLNRK
jgi:hypothetical protein